MSLLIQSYLHRAGLYLFEMSQAVIDQALPDAGLDDKPKGKIKNKLDPASDWVIEKIEKLKDPDGEPAYSTCMNCGRIIRYVAHMHSDQTGQSDIEVGPDCAITLSLGDTQQKMIDYVKKEKTKIAFTIKSLDALEKWANEPISDDAKKYIDWQFSPENSLAFNRPLEATSYSQLCYRALGKVIIADKNHSMVNEVQIKTDLLRLAYRKLLSDYPKELSSALDQAFDDGHSWKEKKYFFSQYDRALSENGLVSKFLMDYDLSKFFKGFAVKL